MTEKIKGKEIFRISEIAEKCDVSPRVVLRMLNAIAEGTGIKESDWLIKEKETRNAMIEDVLKIVNEHESFARGNDSCMCMIKQDIEKMKK